MKTAALFFLLPLSLFAQEFENAPVLSAATILKSEFSTGGGNSVPPDGGCNCSLLDTGNGLVETLGSLPVAVGNDDLVAPDLEWDHAAWTENAAAFAARLKTAEFSGKAPTGFVVARSGDASPLVERKLKEAGLMLAMRPAPGPLK